MTKIAIPLKSITLIRHEGDISECERPVKVSTEGEAEALLAGWASTAPEDGSCHKASFGAEFANGRKVGGRIELYPNGSGVPRIRGKIMDRLQRECGEKIAAYYLV